VKALRALLRESRKKTHRIQDVQLGAKSSVYLEHDEMRTALHRVVVVPRLFRGGT
jgi:hypothetical protein